MSLIILIGKQITLLQKLVQLKTGGCLLLKAMLLWFLVVFLVGNSQKRTLLL